MTTVTQPRTEPTQKELEVLVMIAHGMKVQAMAKKLGISKHAVNDRIRRLKAISGKQSFSALVYWGLTKRLFEIDYRRKWRWLTPMQIEVTQLLALDYSQEAIERKLNLNEYQVERAIVHARKRAGNAKNRPHLVAIAYTEGCIA